MSPAEHGAGGNPLGRARRLVVKIGSALLVDAASGEIRRDWLDGLAEDIAALREAGCEILVVSSGAVALGRRRLGLSRRHLRLEEKQAAAAAGQIDLAGAYVEALARHGIGAALILITLDDTEARRRHVNARNTLETLLRLGSVPVINENDTVAADETRFGDNDRLAARVATMTRADTLVLLSDIDGLYARDPRLDPDAPFQAAVARVTPEIEAMAGKALPGHSTGGMATKLAAARIATEAGCRMAIADGRKRRPLNALTRGARCTWFAAQGDARSAFKRWLGAALKIEGALTVDAGALAALAAGRSLLPAGIVAVEGAFQRGDAVTVRGPDGKEFARGLAAYGAEEARRIMGRNSRDIETVLGYRGREEMIHRDDMALTQTAVIQNVSTEEDTP